jgi:hypothetical protein
MLKQQTEPIQMKDGGYFKDAFPTGVHANSNIDKSIPGNRMTSYFLKLSGTLILMNPQVNTLECKETWSILEKLNVLRINSDEDKSLRTPDDAIQAFLRSDSLDKKILVTPESLGRVIKAARKIGRLSDLYRDYLCLVDESHCFASEKFREKIVRALNYIFRFDNKIFGSATPYEYMHPKIAALKRFKLVYPNPYRHIKIIHSKKAIETLVHMLENRSYPGNVHIFVNSVTAISKIVRLVKSKDINVYCAPEEKNELTMDENKHLMQYNSQGAPATLNFYTCRYAEGWDLTDSDKSTIMFVTDKSIPHSMLSISIKGVQCIGRLREVIPYEIFHITNTYEPDELAEEDRGKIYNKLRHTATSHIQYYNHFHSSPEVNDQDFALYNVIKPFVYRSMKWNKCLNSITLDQHVYEALTKLEYSDINAVEKAWHSRNITTETVDLDYPRIDLNKDSDLASKKKILDFLIKCEKEPQGYQYGEGLEVQKRFKKRYHWMIQCYLLLGLETVIELNYDQEIMKHKIIEYNNNIATLKITAELDKIYKVNDNPTKTSISEVLQGLYDKYEYFTKDGKIEKAKATHLKKFGFQIKTDKSDSRDGNRSATFRILSRDFVCRIAA